MLTHCKQSNYEVMIDMTGQPRQRVNFVCGCCTDICFYYYLTLDVYNEDWWGWRVTVTPLWVTIHTTQDSYPSLITRTTSQNTCVTAT